MDLKTLYRWIPRRSRRWLRRLVREPLYYGNFATWEEAKAASRGYADPAIIEKVVLAARAVRDGRAVWDRDTVLFYSAAANEPLLRSLQHAAKGNGGRLWVVDFGGALGSTWWQHRPWLEELCDVRWSVIEQPALVNAGQREFTSGPLRFFASLKECCAVEQPSVMLLSSVLSYLEDPHALLNAIRQQAFRYVIIDRTGFVAGGRDRLTVQHVPASIYQATYPCWFFDRSKLIASLGPDWQILDEWVTTDDVDIDAEHRGLMLERKV